jgi:hypothetical protein
LKLAPFFEAAAAVAKIVSSTIVKISLPKLVSTLIPTECARDRDLYELVSCCKIENVILFCIIYKTLYLTWGHHALGVILCLCLNFFELSTTEFILQSQRSLKN